MLPTVFIYMLKLRKSHFPLNKENLYISHTSSIGDCTRTTTQKEYKIAD